MSKNTYTNEEIQHMLESLFHEKKKAKQLQQELQALSHERSQLHSKLEKLQYQNAPTIPSHDTALLLELREKLKSKESDLSKTHMQLLEKQRDLAALKELLEQEKKSQRDPEDEDSLQCQIEKLKEYALSYKSKYEELLVSQSSNEKLDKIYAQLEVEKELKASLETELLQIYKKIESSHLEKRQALQEVESLKEQLLKADNQKEYNELKLAYEDQSDDNTSLKQQVEKLRNWFKSAEEKVRCTETELQDLRKKSEAFDFTIAQLTEENRRAQAKQVVLHESVEDLQDANEVQRQRIEQLTEMLLEKEKKLTEVYEIENSLKKTLAHQHSLESSLQSEEEKNRILLSSKETLDKQFGELKLHAEQVDKGIHYLRLKMEEYKLEAQQLGEELTLAQEQIEKLNQDIHQERELSTKNKEGFDKEKLVNQEALEELAAIKGQFDQMKNQIFDHSNTVQKKNDEFNLAQRTIQALQKDKYVLENILSEKGILIQSLEKELNSIKHTIAKGHHEVQELENRNQELISQSTRASSESQQMKNQIAHLQDELQKHQIEKIRIHQLETKCLQLSQNEEEKQIKISNLTQEIQRLSESYKGMYSQLEEKDAQLKMAQQHLARKVKDNTLLNERAEEQKNQLLELQHQVQSTQLKMTEMRNTLETRQHQETRLQEALNETIKTSEVQLQKWEEKYFKLYEKWTETETSNKELKKLEEKYTQMQALLNNFRSVLGNPESPMPSLPEKIAPSETISQPPIQQKDLLAPPPPSQQSPIRYKQNLFD